MRGVCRPLPRHHPSPNSGYSVERSSLVTDIILFSPSGDEMAKTRRTLAATGHQIEEFAEDLGKMLGHARTKAEGWLGQRQTIVKNLTQLRDEATSLLNQLGHDAGKIVSRVRRGRPVGSKNVKDAAPVRKRRKMSAKARAAISAAQKARWAKRKAAKP
jgi:hypothetical protein